MTFRRRWVAVLALSPVVLLFAVISGATFPFVADAFQLKCYGEGDSFTCPDNRVYLASVLYSAVLITIAVMIIAMLAIVVTTASAHRRLLARDVQLVTLVVAILTIMLGARIATALSGIFLLAGICHLVATALLIVALVRSSRRLAVVACLIGIASAFGPLTSPVIGAFQAIAVGCFVITLIPLVARWQSPALSTRP